MSEGRVLKGLAEIADYLRAHPTTVHRWVHERGLPVVTRGRRGGKFTWVTTTTMLDSWMMAEHLARLAEKSKAAA